MKKYILFLICVVLLSACNKPVEKKETVLQVEEKKIDQEKIQDSIQRVELELKYEAEKPEIKYTQVVLRNNAHRNEVLREHNENVDDMSKNRVFCLLNRKARYFMKVGDTVVVPNKYDAKLTAYSLFPQYYYGARDIPKLIVVSNLYLCYGAYENGRLVHFSACNTGKEKTPTYPGRYSFVWKEKEHLSSLDSTWVMPFNWNFHQYAGCAFHQFTMPGYAASHSCVRQFKEDAEWLYYWAKKAKLAPNKREYIHLSGTPIIVLDVFDYRRPKTGPWVALKSNQDHIIALPEHPMEVEDAVIPISQIPVGARSRLPNKDKYRYGEDTLRARGTIRPGVVLTVSKNFNVLKRQKKLAEEKKKKAAEEAAAAEMQKAIEETMQSNSSANEYLEEIEHLKSTMSKDTSKIK